MERIPVLFALTKLGVMVGSMVCPICEEEVESADRLSVLPIDAISLEHYYYLV